MLRLLGLPDAVKAMLDAGDLSAGHARALLAAPAPEALAREVAEKGLSVRQTEQLVQRAARSPRTAATRGPKQKDADTRALETDLSDRLGLRVAIASKGREGSVTLYYKPLDQLDGLLQRLSGQAAGD